MAVLEYSGSRERKRGEGRVEAAGMRLVRKDRKPLQWNKD